MQALEESFPGVETDRSDGLKLIMPGAWIHVRASNTEPLLRMAVEARSETEVEGLYARVLALFDASFFWGAAKIGRPPIEAEPRSVTVVCGTH